MTGPFFDPINHGYYYDGARWPSVTQALTSAGHITAQWYTPEGAERGRRIHRVAFLMDALGDEFNIQTVPADIGGEVEAYRQFLRDEMPEWSHVEEPFWSTRWRCGGRPDRVALRLRGRTGLVELKSGARAPWHGIQTAGYQHLKPTGARWILYLEPSGRYKLWRCDRAEDHRDYQIAITETWASWLTMPTQ